LISPRSAVVGAAKDCKRRPGAGRPAKPARQVFVAVMYVLRTGYQWKAFPRSASAVHKLFLEWDKAYLFESLWKAGLAEYDEILVRYEKLDRSFKALSHLAAAVITFQKVPLAVNAVYGWALRL
jgi:transposase